jgi:hypothetical protein
MYMARAYHTPPMKGTPLVNLRMIQALHASQTRHMEGTPQESLCTAPAYRISSTQHMPRQISAPHRLVTFPAPAPERMQ